MNDMVPVDRRGAIEVPVDDVTPAPDALLTHPSDHPDADGMTRRNFLGTMSATAATTMGRGLGLAGAGVGIYGGYKAYGALTAPRQVHVAIMRLDTKLNTDGTQSDQTALCLDHRVATEQDPENPTARDTEQQIDVSANANSLKPEGHEALVLSPDLMIQANDPEAGESKTNIGGHHISITNNAADVFIPFQLLENAQSATFGYNAAGKLTLTIKSLPVEIPPTVAQQISDAATTAQRDTACAAARTRNGMRQYVPDVISGILPDSMTGPSDESSCTPLPPREKRYATATSTITLEGATRGNLPNIHLYDTRRFNADYHLAGDFRIEADNLHKRIIQGNGDLLASNLTGKNNAEMIALAPNRRFNEPTLQRGFEASRLGVSTEYSNSLVEQLASFTKNWDFNPEGLNSPERNAMNMAVDFKQREFEGKGWLDRLSIRADQAMGTIPTR